jgi:hypothetical protein
MEESRAEEEEIEWLRLPLPERPHLRPLRSWPSRYPVTVLAFPFLAIGLQILVMRTASGGLVALALMAALLGSMGLTIVVRRIAVVLRARARDREPIQPWIHDHGWDERGEARTWFVRMAEASAGNAGWRRVALTVLAVLGVALARGGVSWPSASCFAAAATLLASAVWSIHGAGDSHLTFTKFPFHPGEAVTLYFRMAEGGAQFHRVEFCIAHVEEYGGGMLDLERRIRRLFTGFDRRPPGPLPGPDYDVELTFDVPEVAPGTCISDRFPHYWVLEVRGATTAGPYFERFLVPIYERPAAAADAGDSHAAPAVPSEPGETA